MEVSERFFNDRVILHCDDCRAVLATLANCSIDSVVTDPPYSLVSIVKRFGKEGSAACIETGTYVGGNPYGRTAKGFMGKAWDSGEVAFDPTFWAEVLRVLKPGGHLIAMGGTRTYHRLACAIEDAGFEIRDQIGWVYGSGFPKSHNVGNGWGTALKPAWEPCVLARKPLSEGTVAANVLRWGTGAINIDGCRVETNEIKEASIERAAHQTRTTLVSGMCGGSIRHNGSGTNNTLGRWPANILHDGSEEVVGAFPDTASGGAPSPGDRNSDSDWGNFAARSMTNHGSNKGSAARFFYTAKADSDDRLGSKHPTVKPLDLMQYLCRLITPPGGTVLDPFSGTGTTGEAAFREGFRAVLIEREAEYQADIRRRMALVMSGPDERAWESVKARNLIVGYEDLPLFAEGSV